MKRLIFAITLSSILLGVKQTQAQTPIFVDSGQRLGDDDSYAVVLGDLDGDNDLDAVVGNNHAAETIWLNDGNGFFTYLTSFDAGWASSLAIGDLDNDDDLDLVVGNQRPQGPNTVWLNDGSGNFEITGQSVGQGHPYDVELGDIDSDGDIDLVVVSFPKVNEIWYNDGTGFFKSSVSFTARQNSSVELLYLNDDLHLDALIGGSSQHSTTVFMNDGDGLLIDSGQRLLNGFTADLVVADFDNDDDIDIFAANSDRDPMWSSDRLWWNEGDGYFADSGYLYSDYFVGGASGGDIDGDGDVDIVIGTSYRLPFVFLIMLNEGSGEFLMFEEQLDIDTAGVNDVALGDLDGDRDLDVFIARAPVYPGLVSNNQVWLNTTDEAPTDVSVSALSGEQWLMERNYWLIFGVVGVLVSFGLYWLRQGTEM